MIIFGAQSCQGTHIHLEFARGKIDFDAVRQVKYGDSIINEQILPFMEKGIVYIQTILGKKDEPDWVGIVMTMVSDRLKIANGLGLAPVGELWWECRKNHRGSMQVIMLTHQREGSEFAADCIWNTIKESCEQ